MRLIDDQDIKLAALRASRDNLERARRLGRERPELVAYVVAATQDFGGVAKAAAWRGLELCCEALDAGCGEQRATIDEVLELHDRNLDFALAIGECDPRIAHRYLGNTTALRQRSLLRRLSDDVSRAVPAGQRGAVFLILKTVVDLIDERDDREAARVGA